MTVVITVLISRLLSISALRFQSCLTYLSGDILSVQALQRRVQKKGLINMIEITQNVTNANKDLILARYLDLGWSFLSLHGSMDNIVKLRLSWTLESPPVYPDLSDLQ